MIVRILGDGQYEVPDDAHAKLDQLDDDLVKACESVEPPASDVVGGFDVDHDGRIVPGSFEYNAHHAWFDPDSGPSGLLADRQFYDWLHPMGDR